MLVDVSKFLVPVARIVDVETGEIVDTIHSGESIRKARSYGGYCEDDEHEYAVIMIESGEEVYRIPWNYEKRSKRATFVDNYMICKQSTGELSRASDYSTRESFRKKGRELFKKYNLINTDWDEDMLRNL